MQHWGTVSQMMMAATWDLLRTEAQQSSDGYVERPFCFMCQKRYGWPCHAWWRNVSLCSSSNAKRERTWLHNSSSCTIFMPLLTWSFPLKDTKKRFYEGEQLLLFLDQSNMDFSLKKNSVFYWNRKLEWDIEDVIK